MSTDAPTPPALRWVMTIRVDVGEPLELGSMLGSARRTIPILGGEFSGPQLQGIVLHGGADWQLTRADRVAVLDARYTLQTTAGELIAVTNRGFRHGQPGLASRFAAGERVPPSEYYFMTAPLFETSAPALQWLNRSIFMGAGEREQTSVTLTIWQVGNDSSA